MDLMMIFICRREEENESQPHPIKTWANHPNWLAVRGNLDSSFSAIYHNYYCWSLRWVCPLFTTWKQNCNKMLSWKNTFRLFMTWKYARRSMRVNVMFWLIFMLPHFQFTVHRAQTKPFSENSLLRVDAYSIWYLCLFHSIDTHKSIIKWTPPSRNGEGERRENYSLHKLLILWHSECFSQWIMKT